MEDQELVKIENENTFILPAGNAEIDMQITTAKRYPRSIETFRKTAAAMATMDEETAAGCFYVVPKGGKNIEGPGVRLSEIVAIAYKNLRFGSKFIGETEDRKSVIAEGFCYDLENNVASAIQVTRRIVDKYGKRYSDDVIETTKLAAMAIAKRNAIFNIVPLLYVQETFERAKRVAIGKASAFSDTRKKWVEYFLKFGVQQDRILSALKKPSVDDLDMKDIETLIGMHTAIKDGDIDIDKAFPPLVDVSKSETLADKVKAKAAETKESHKDVPQETARDVREMPRNAGGAVGGPTPSGKKETKNRPLFPSRVPGEEG